jgi:hypothetical protein
MGGRETANVQVRRGGMLDIAQFKSSRTTDGEVVWFSTVANPACDIAIAGDASAPDLERLKLARQAEAHFGILAENAQRHLHAFFREDGTQDAWSLETIEFGKTRHDPADVFIFYFNKRRDDVHGLYHASYSSFLTDFTRLRAVMPFAIGRTDR